MLRLWVDEGHGGADSGAVGGGFKEDDRNLLLGNKVEAFARAKGWTVESTRDVDEFEELADRYQRANRWGADIFVSIHHDWTGGRQAVIYPNSNDAREATSMRLADVINRKIDALAPTKSIIYADRRGLAGLRGTKMPAAIIEAGRVQDPYDVDAMAKAIVEGIEEFAGKKATPAPKPAPAPARAPKPKRAPGWPGRYIKLKRPLMRGADVRQWQAQMRKRGWRIAVDGYFGPQSNAVLRAFQKEKGLKVDGILGPKSWAAAWTAPVT